MPLAQIDGVVSGLQVAVIESKEDSSADDDPIEQKLLEAYRAKKRGQYKASAAHAVDAINMIAAEFHITCGASL